MIRTEGERVGAAHGTFFEKSPATGRKKGQDLFEEEGDRYWGEKGHYMGELRPSFPGEEAKFSYRRRGENTFSRSPSLLGGDRPPF